MFWYSAWKNEEWFNEKGVVLEKDFNSRQDAIDYLRNLHALNRKSNSKCGRIYMGSSVWAIVDTGLESDPDKWEKETKNGECVGNVLKS